jgi:hypothetical protein
MEAEKKKDIIEIVDLGANVDESAYISPEVAAAMAGDQVEMGKQITDVEESTEDEA